MDVVKLLDIFGEIDADEILDHLGDKKKLEKAAEIIRLVQEGFVRGFDQEDAVNASFDWHGKFIGHDWSWVVEEMRENRLKVALEVFPEADEQTIVDLLWDESICSLSDARFQHDAHIEAQING